MCFTKSSSTASCCRVLRRPLEPALPAGSLLDVAKHIGSLRYRVWEKMQRRIRFSELSCDISLAVIVGP